MPWKGVVVFVTVLTKLPETKNDTLDVLFGLFTKVRGETGGPAGVQVCPNAGGAPQPAGLPTPAASKVRSNLRFGFELNVTKLLSRVGVPTGTLPRFKFIIVPGVLISGPKTPVEPIFTVNVPGGTLGGGFGLNAIWVLLIVNEPDTLRSSARAWRLAPQKTIATRKTGNSILFSVL